MNISDKNKLYKLLIIPFIFAKIQIYSILCDVQKWLNKKEFFF